MMIDYDKLKIAHTFIDKCESHYLAHINSKKHGHEYTLVDWKIEMPDLIYDNIDDLITKLRELTQSEPKYKKGQTVWTLTNHEAPDDIIEITLNQDINDDEGLYPSKAALIEAQIEYWSNMQYSQEPLPINNGGRGERELNPTFKATDSWYKQAAKDEDEYCNVSGAKLGKREECLDKEGRIVWSYKEYAAGLCSPTQVSKPKEGTTGCQHESDNMLYSQTPDAPSRKCKKCGEFYR